MTKQFHLQKDVLLEAARLALQLGQRWWERRPAEWVQLRPPRPVPPQAGRPSAWGPPPGTPAPPVGSDMLQSFRRGHEF